MGFDAVAAALAALQATIEAEHARQTDRQWLEGFRRRYQTFEDSHEAQQPVGDRAAEVWEAGKAIQGFRPRGKS